MKIKSTLLSVALAAVLWTSAVSGQEMMEPDSAKIAEYMQLALPGPEHEILKKMSGTWDLSFTMWPQPGMAPMQAETRSTDELVLGGRYLRSHSVGSLMGQTIERIAFMGYDRRNEEYTMVAYDNMATYYVTAFGSYDEDTKTLRLSGEDYDGFFDFTQEYDINIKFVDDNTMMTEVIFKDEVNAKGGEPFKQIEIMHRRVK